MSLAIVFGGGGVRGAFQAGVWAEIGSYLQPDFVIGSSIGAIHAWATTRLTPTALADWWEHRVPNHLWPRQTQPLRQLISAISAQPAAKPWPALAVATRLRARRSHVVTLTETNAAAWLLASAAMPGWFSPQRIDHHLFVDGGVANDLPVAIARDLGATKILAVSALGLGPTPAIGDVPVLYPPKHTGAMFDFSLKHRQILLQAGHQAGQAWLQSRDAQSFLASSY
jgi:NTE family protein